MPKKPSLKINFMLNSLLTASSILFSLLSYPHAFRVLLAEGTGRVAFVTSMVSYFSMVAALGIPTYGIRACAQVRDNPSKLNQTVQEIFLLNGIMTILSYIAIVISIHSVERFRQEAPLFLVCSSTLIFNLIGMEWLYKGLEQYQYITVHSIIFKFLSIALVFLFIQTSDDYIIFGAIMVLATVGSKALNFFHTRQLVKICRCKHYDLKRHLKPTFVFFALTIATTIYTNLDVVMLGFLKDNQEVGYYDAAVKIKALLVSLVTALGAVLLPRISYYIENNYLDEGMRLVKRAVNFVLMCSIPLCFYFIFMAQNTILFLSGSGFQEAVIPMKIIMPTIIFIGLTNIIGFQMLVPFGKELEVFYSTLVGAIVDLILNMLLIPRYGAAGAAMGTLFAELVVLLVQLFFIRTQLSIILQPIHLFKILVAMAPAGFFVLLLQRIYFSSIFLSLIVTAFVFFGTYLLGLLFLKYRL